MGEREHSDDWNTNSTNENTDALIAEFLAYCKEKSRDVKEQVYPVIKKHWERLTRDYLIMTLLRDYTGDADAFYLYEKSRREMNVSFVVLHYRHYNSVCHDIIDDFLKEHTRDAVREVTRTVQKELSDIGIDVSDEAMLKCVDNLDMNKNEIFNAICSDEGNAFTKKHFPFKSWGADKVSLREYDRRMHTTYCSGSTRRNTLEVSLCRKCLKHPDREQFENVHGEYLFPSWVLNEMLEEDSRCLCVPEDADWNPTP